MITDPRMSTRRKFIVNCSAAVAALALAPLTALKAPAGGARTFQLVDEMSGSDWAAQAATRFQARLASGQTVELQLLKVRLGRTFPSQLGRRPPADANFEKFSLIFSGPKDVLLDPAIHRFEHAQLGRFEMYVGPVGTTDAGSVRYETVFNRPAPARAGQFT